MNGIETIKKNNGTTESETLNGLVNVPARLTVKEKKVFLTGVTLGILFTVGTAIVIGGILVLIS